MFGMCFFFPLKIHESLIGRKQNKKQTVVALLVKNNKQLWKLLSQTINLHIEISLLKLFP